MFVHKSRVEQKLQNEQRTKFVDDSARGKFSFTNSKAEIEQFSEIKVFFLEFNFIMCRGCRNEAKSVSEISFHVSKCECMARKTGLVLKINFLYQANTKKIFKSF